MKISIRRSVIRRTLGAAFLIGTLGSGLFAQNVAPAAAPVKKLTDSINPELPRWVSFSGEYRVRVEGLGGIGYNPANKDAFFLNRVRLNTLIKPTSWMRVMLQAQDAQAMGRKAKPDVAPFEDTFDLRQAFVEIGNPESDKVALRVGRQELVFGEQRLIGHLNWTNTARTFDGVRGTVRSGKARVDVFAASVVRFYEGAFNKRGDGDNIHGAYAVLSVLPNKGTVEPFLFWREQSWVKSEAGPIGKMNAQTIGVRFAGKLPSNFDYVVETIGQFGSVATDDVRAYAGRVTLGHTLAKAKFKPRLVAAFDYASGDSDPTDGRRETFDQLYPTGHDKIGLADQVGWKNTAAARAGVEMKVSPKLALTSYYHSWWLADPHDALYNAPGNSVVKVAAGTAGRHVGQEADIQAIYNFNSLFQVAAGFAHLIPGTFLKNVTPGDTHRFTYVMATYQF